MTHAETLREIAMLSGHYLDIIEQRMISAALAGRMSILIPVDELDSHMMGDLASLKNLLTNNGYHWAAESPKEIKISW
jgi:hypothetical protein